MSTTNNSKPLEDQSDTKLGLRQIIECQRNPRFFFFFNDTATTEIYTLSLHDALPISPAAATGAMPAPVEARASISTWVTRVALDRKSTRLNSSHLVISYAVFCLKKKDTSQIYAPEP